MNNVCNPEYPLPVDGRPLIERPAAAAGHNSSVPEELVLKRTTNSYVDDNDDVPESFDGFLSWPLSQFISLKDTLRANSNPLYTMKFIHHDQSRA